MPTSNNARSAIEQIRNRLHEQVKDLPPDEYRDVLETIGDDIKARAEALEQELEDAKTRS